jgi:hypothetical protein
MALTRPAATDTLASPALDLVLSEYADAIEALEAHQVTKRVTAALSSAMSGNSKVFNTAGADLNTRFLFAFPVAPTRFRLRMRNYSALNDTAGTGTATVTAFHGTPATPDSSFAYRWKGAFAASPTQITFGGNTSGTLSAGDELTSDWITNTTYTTGQPVVFSIGYASIYNVLTAAGSDSCGGVSLYASGAAANANALTITGPNALVYVDTRIEYEYSTDFLANGNVRNPVVLFVGDSITAGHLQSDYSTSGPWNYKIDTFPEQVGLRANYGIVNAGVGQSRIRQSPISGTTSGWDQVTSAAHVFLSRFDLSTTVPDAAVVMLGTNDCGAGTPQTYTNIISSYSTVISNLRSLGIARIYLCTIPPGGRGLPLSLTGNANNNSKTITNLSSTRTLTIGMPVTGTGIGTGSIVDAILSDTSVSVSVSTTAPITGGALSFGSASPDYATDAAETLRQQLNTWIRTKPGNATSVYDVASVLESSLPGIADARYLPYYPHPSLAGFARIADTIRV